MTKKSGFTLIELMVVVAVIVVLISLLLPSLKAARDAAKTAACLSNLRQQVVGDLAYANDNRGWVIQARAFAGGSPPWNYAPYYFYPPATPSQYNGVSPLFYVDFAVDYLGLNRNEINNSNTTSNGINKRDKRIKLLSCPARSTADLIQHDPRTPNPYGQSFGSQLNDYKVFYETNGHVMEGSQFGTTARANGLIPTTNSLNQDYPYRINWLDHPSELVYHWDAISYENGHGYWGSSPRSYTSAPDGAYVCGYLDALIAPHNKCCNWVAYDGHAETLAHANLLKLTVRWPGGYAAEK